MVVCHDINHFESLPEHCQVADDHQTKPTDLQMTEPPGDAMQGNGH